MKEGRKMKKYELLNIEVVDSLDVITTSGDVTTEEIPWGTLPASSSLYELAAVNEVSYELR